jgi:outer membrane protein assembly factor BamB
VASGGLVYVNGLESGGTTYAVDGRTGKTVWTASTFDGSFGTVAVAGGIVYEAEACDQLSAFDALSGKLLWYHSTNCTGGGAAAPAVHGGLIWVRDVAQGNFIIDTAGTVKGSFAADVVPSFDSDTVYYVRSGTLTAVEIQTNRLKWSFAADADPFCTSAVVAQGGGQVFVGSASGNIYEIDEATGAQRSVSNAGGAVTCGSETTSMGLSAGHLLVPAGDRLVVY